MFLQDQHAQLLRANYAQDPYRDWAAKSKAIEKKKAFWRTIAFIFQPPDFSCLCHVFVARRVTIMHSIVVPRGSIYRPYSSHRLAQELGEQNFGREYISGVRNCKHFCTDRSRELHPGGCAMSSTSDGAHQWHHILHHLIRRHPVQVLDTSSAHQEEERNLLHLPLLIFLHHRQCKVRHYEHDRHDIRR